MSQSEEIKSKLDIVEVIREYINVKAVGANFQALCPFHNEKTPSFVISPEKQIWHCFGCGRGGDVFAFVMEKEGLGFMEALRLLAPKAGVVLQYENPAAYSERNRILDILELAGKYYAHLLKTPAGQSAREYLLGRGLKEAALEEWQLGYSPDAWENLTNFLHARPLNGRKYSDEEIFMAGLAVKKENGRGGYDRFRNRIMFPIWDVNNNLIAFSARLLPAQEKTEKAGKYINSPQTKVYDKSRVLFALNKAKQAIRQTDLAIVVEGQMDAIACHNHGFKNVVASSGTALTTEQVSLIKRFTNNLALAFDMDDAGQMAADRGIKEALAQEMNLQVVTLPQGKDPDECLRNNPEDFAKAVASAPPMLEYYFQKISRGLNLETITDRRIVEEKMLIMLAAVNNHVERSYWLKRLNEEIGTDEKELREKLSQIKAPRSAETHPKTAARAATVSRPERLAERLLAVLLRFPNLITYVLSNLEPEGLAGEENSRFYKNLIIYYNKSTSYDYEAFYHYLLDQGEAGEKLLNKLVLLGEKDFYSYDEGQAKSEAITIMLELKKYYYQQRIKKLEKAVAQAEKEERSEALEMLMVEIKSLTDQLQNIKLT